MAEKIFEAKVDKLHDVLAFSDEELEKHNCNTKTQMTIAIMVEEVFVNIASYAYPGSVGQATIKIDFEDNKVVYTFIDNGIPFNPLAKEDPDVSAKAEDRNIGGLGIYMVKKTMDEVSYDRKDGMNIFVMKKDIH